MPFNFSLVEQIVIKLPVAINAWLHRVLICFTFKYSGQHLLLHLDPLNTVAIETVLLTLSMPQVQTCTKFLCKLRIKTESIVGAMILGSFCKVLEPQLQLHPEPIS